MLGLAGLRARVNFLYLTAVLAGLPVEYLLVVQAAGEPLGGQLSAQGLVEADRGLVPIQHLPHHPPAICVLGVLHSDNCGLQLMRAPHVAHDVLTCFRKVHLPACIAGRQVRMTAATKSEWICAATNCSRERQSKAADPAQKGIY